MRAVELEGRVVAAIEARRNANVSPEDDFVECKGRWPEKDKARQLAALANRAAGEPVVLIVGFDDRSGAVVDPGPTDPADWWQGMVGQFDQTPLDMLRHMLVHIGPTEKVHAFAFGTDRVPYVVKNGQGRDVPMRDGTSTRSAYRHELLRLLLPTVGLPRALVLNAGFGVTWQAARAEQKDNYRTFHAREEGVSFHGRAGIFIEHRGAEFAMLPAHGMRGTVFFDGEGFPVDLDPLTPGDNAAPPSVHGVEVRHDGIVVTGPGAFSTWIKGTLPLDKASAVENARQVLVTFDFDVVMNSKPVHAEATLMRVEAIDYSTDLTKQRSLGSFKLGTN